jgi:DNA mismatch endonuclease, patch repair protein
MSSYQPRDPAVTSAVMSSIRRKDNKSEAALRKALYHRGYRYRLQVAGLPGRPDIAFSGRRVAVFVDGDFWHGRVLREQGEEAFLARMKTPHKNFWLKKMSRNIARDDRDTARLEEAGWSVLRIWESEVRANLGTVVERIASVLDER